MFALSLLLFRLIASSDRKETMTEIDYNNQEDHYFSKSDLALRSMVEHTLNFIHLSDTEKAKEELSKRRFRYIQTEIELFESSLVYNVISSMKQMMLGIKQPNSRNTVSL